MDQPIQVGDSVILRPGERYEALQLDMSGWRGRVVEIDDDGELLIAWDSQTMREMPETAVASWLVAGIDWTCMTVESEAVLPYDARDDVADSLQAARERFAAHGYVFDELTDNPLYDDLIDEAWDDEWAEDELWMPERPPYFDLDQFLYGLDIPTQEHPRIRSALSRGLGEYFRDRYGRYHYGKQPADQIPEYMAEPFVFGYGVLEVLARKQISRESKVKICQYALATMDPGDEDGLPYGLITILGFLAQEDALTPSLFQVGMVAQEFGGIGFLRRSIWPFGTDRDAVLALLDWLAATPDIDDEEKLYWVWRWSLQSEHDSHLVKALANHWLAKDNVPADVKETLCWAWLREADNVGAQPPALRLMDTFMAGDRDKLQQLLIEFGADPSDLPLPEQMPPDIDEDEEGLTFQLMHGLRRTTLVPAPLKRIAVPALARLGQDPLTVAEMFWEGDHDYYTDAIFGGIADLLREFQAQIPPDALRRLVEKGLANGRVSVRKAFHLLARDLYDGAYLPQAAGDRAKSLRTWAQKQMAKRSKR